MIFLLMVNETMTVHGTEIFVIVTKARQQTAAPEQGPSF